MFTTLPLSQPVTSLSAEQQLTPPLAARAVTERMVTGNRPDARFRPLFIRTSGHSGASALLIIVRRQ